ncbi:PAS domain-containing protein, partial [Streptomyces albiflaviniger]|nr:PAS domain-containing protein [Streptomyces albiflaviniger]
MEYGTSRCDDGRGEPPVVPEQRRGVHGRMPLAVVVIDAEGRVTHWSSGARRLFGPTRQQAVGRLAVDLMPVSGALRGAEVRTDATGSPELDDSRLGTVYYPTAGRARMA